MKKTGWLRIKSGMLALALLGTGIISPNYGYAEETDHLIETVVETECAEETGEVSETESISETQEISQTEIETEKETDTVFQTETGSELETGSEAETTSESDEKKFVENSFRYNNGEWIHNEISLFAARFTPWSFADGNWLNSQGEPIIGAVKKGIDVSYIQKQIDWEAVAKTDVSYAIIRCGYGNNEVSQDDSWWKYNADECTRFGIPFGVYIYSYALNTDEARSEAEHVLRLVEGYNLSLPIYFDLEDERYTGRLSNKEIADIAEVFCNTVQSAGYEVGIYANLTWFRNRLTDWRFSQWPRWVAQYNYECDYEKKYTMWQCTSSGIVDGIDGLVDLNFTMDIEPKEPEVAPPEQQVEDFVIRLYELVLNRKPDEIGLKDWKMRLLNQEETGAEVARGFIMSNEFLKRNLSDEAYVEILYQTFLNRGSDKVGKSDWLKQLSQGLSREYVFRGFAESKEFGSICDSYGIIRGNIALMNVMDLNPQVTMFVYRNYTQFLEREPDQAGHLDWVTKLVQGEKNVEQVAYGFVFSRELIDKSLSNEEYVKVLYRGLFDREADEGGLRDWVNRLNQGQSREKIFEGFCGSEEFKKMVARFGL